MGARWASRSRPWPTASTAAGGEDSGSVTSVALFASTPLAAVSLHDWGTLIWMVWFVGVGVLMVRHRDDERARWRFRSARRYVRAPSERR